jgi:hypothetical protein
MMHSNRFDVGGGMSVEVETEVNDEPSAVFLTIEDATAGRFYAALSPADARQIGEALIKHAMTLETPHR